MKCLKCGYKNDNDAEFCENCGNPLAQYCPNCGAALKPGASFCKKCGAPVSQPSPAGIKEPAADRQPSTLPEKEEKTRKPSTKIEGERKLVTILFTDIVGSTSMVEKIDPEEWKEIVSGAHKRVIQVIHHYEGTIAQLLGDGVLAFFGAPVTHEDDPVRAVRAALDIQNEITRYAYELKGYIDNFHMRIGVNTGMVVVGNVGTEQHMEYLAIGDAVNLAARLQSAAQPGKVLISESTERLVRTAFELGEACELTLKGKAEPVRAFEVLQAKAITESYRGFEELASPLVGRSKELGELSQALDELCHGHGQIVTVLGEAGIGKSRLVEEARCTFSPLEIKEQPAESCELHWIEGRALSYGTTLSFWSISQLIKDDLGLSDADPEPRIHLALSRRISQLFTTQSDQVMPYLAQLLGVRLDGEQAEKVSLLDAETLKRQTLISISQYIERLALSQPTVAVFEDLHWADPSSLEALELLLSVTDRAPLMLLMLSRPEREMPSWGIKLKTETLFPHRLTEIQLKPLSASQQDELVDNLLKIADLPEALRLQIQEHAEGNPFYLEEIIRDLIEQGAIIHSGSQWVAIHEILDVDIPDTLQGVLLARLDRLQEDVRRTLQLASVVGRSFLYSILEAITEAEQVLDQHLAQLQRVDLVREKARLPELEYMFKHSLTQEAAYSSLLVARRSEFHHKVGEALEKLFPERLEEFYGILAHHFEAAGETQKAVDYLMRAGDKARSMAELEEAIGYYQRIIPLLTGAGDMVRLAQAWLKLGLVYTVSFQFEEAYHANEQAFALQQQIGKASSASLMLKPAVLRMSSVGGHYCLDPADATWEMDFRIVANLFSGLVQIDTELNLVPDVARSWQVLDGGKRYIFALRDDSRWSDGSRVTAHDFEYAWKRNLTVAFAKESGTPQFLFDIAGAPDYSEGRNPDPASVGVHALDDYTLEVHLVEPVAYFPYILSLPVSYPLPRRVIERFGDDWWKGEKMVSNGPYRLVEFDANHGSIIERNPYYQAEFRGNVQRAELTFVQSYAQLNAIYQEDAADLTFMELYDIQSDVPTNEMYFYSHPRLNFFVLNPFLAPLNDERVRRALAYALDRDALVRKFGIQKADGGLVPPGIPGHSPDIGLHYDPDMARQLLTEAGYPGGKGFPSIFGFTKFSIEKIAREIIRQWQDNLGIEASFRTMTPADLMDAKIKQITFNWYIAGWIFDYPDPDNILAQPNAYIGIYFDWGWHDETYLHLVKEAGRTPSQKRRMELYRQADHLMVQEKVLVIPVSYGGKSCALVKPWVKNVQITPAGRMSIKDIIIEDH